MVGCEVELKNWIADPARNDGGGSVDGGESG
jgi:hypothetical protein